MKNKALRISLGILLGLFLVLGTLQCLPAKEVYADGLWEFDGNNKAGNTYMDVETSYLTTTGDGMIMRFQAAPSIDGYLAEYYTKEYKARKQVLISKELPLFGAFYESADYYFVISGQNNPDQDNALECYRITKYDKEWNRLGSAGLSKCNTTYPFDGGSCRVAEYNGYLLIRTCHEMYRSSDGLIHQANVTIEYDIANNEITDSYTGVMNTSYGYASHSFNQFVRMDGEKLVAMDHGDAYPRSLALFVYKDVSDGKFISGKSYGNITYRDILSFPGATGNNYTAAYSGGLEVSSSSYLAAASWGQKNDRENLASYSTCRNVVIGVVDKSTLSVKESWLTDYAEDDTQISVPKLVKISDSSFYVLWSQGSTVYYQQIDDKGAKVGEMYSMEGVLTDCQPVVIDGHLVWYYWNGLEKHFYRIDLSNPSEPEHIQRGINVTSVELSTEYTSYYTFLGDQIQYTATVLPENATNPKLEWHVSNEDAFSIDENGLLTVIGVGSGYVYCKTTDGTNITRYGSTLRAYRKIEECSLSKSSITIDVGETAELIYTVKPTEGTMGVYEQLSGNGTIFEWDKEAGTVTGIAPGNGYILYSANDDRTKEPHCFVYVYGKMETPDSLELSSKTATSVTLVAEDGMQYSKDGINWQNSATFTGLTSNTEYSFYVRRKSGGTYYRPSDAYGPLVVKTDIIPVTAVKVSPVKKTIKEEETFTITETITPYNASIRQIDWTSPDTKVATVERNDAGQLVVTGVKYGKVILTGVTTDGSNIEAQVEVMVLEKEHAWDEGTVTKDPTCTATGTKHFTCTVCGETRDDVMEKTPHTEVTDKAVAPTCTETGLTEGSHCSVCKKVLVAQTEVKVLGHDVVTDQAKKETCTEDGLTEGSHCDRCKKVFVAQKVIPALGHDWDKGTITVKPGCETTGLKVYVCSRCKGEKKEILPANGHTVNLIEGKAATCKESGLTDGAYCPVCEKVLTEQQVIPKLEHTKITDKAVKVGCLTNGLTEGSHCSVCGEILVAQKIIPATGHDWGEGVVTKKPTCKVLGERTFTCGNCGETRTEEIPMLEHTFSEWTQSEEDVNLVERSCSVCGYTEQSEHRWDAGVTQRNPGCENRGEILYTCLDCEATKTVYTDAMGHKWDNGEVTKEVTCTEDGERTFTCQTCQKSRKEPIPAPGHTPVIDPEIPATEEETGLTEGSHCGVCKKVLVEQQVIPVIEKAKYFYEWVDGLWYNLDGTQTYPYHLSWKKNNTGWWAVDESGRFPSNRWLKVDGEWYFFNVYGYIEVNAYRNGYYLQADGKWDGKRHPGWKQTADGWNYLLEDGTKLADTWKKIDGKWYYFKADGTMASYEWVQGCWLNANGAWTYLHRGEWYHNRNGWYYQDTSGWYAKNGTYTIDGVKYTFDRRGYCVNP